MSDARDVWIQQLAIAQHEEALRDKRDEALRRLQDVVHLQTAVQAWAHDVGVVERGGDPLCGSSGGQMVRAEARVTCPKCRELMEMLPRRDDEIRREEALRRLQSAQELFGRGDQQQWHRYERDDGRDVSQTVFAVWDSGAKSLFSGMENTALFTRPEAEVELTRLMQDADANSYEIGALLHAMESRG